MVKYNVVVSDPPWFFFFDRLKMSKTNRGAEDQYNVINDQDIINLDVKNIVEDNAFLVMWVPGSKLDVGIECCKKWGFKPIQTWVWVKTKKDPLKFLYSNIVKILKNKKSMKEKIKLIKNEVVQFDLNNCLNFFMGHSFRQTHEIAIVGARGRYTKILKDKSQRSVFIGPAIDKHSEKPEELQDKLDKMFGNVNKLEMFARRDRPGWTCIGDQCQSTYGEDIKDSLERIRKMP